MEDLHPVYCMQQHMSIESLPRTVLEDQPVHEVRMVRLPDAAPESVPPPQFSSITANSFTVVASPPVMPNGALTKYRLYQNGTQINTMPSPNPQTSTVTFQVIGLSPFTVYIYYNYRGVHCGWVWSE